MEHQKIKDFENEINSLIDEFQSTASQYDEVSITTETSLFNIANVLAEMKVALGNDGEKKFKATKKETAKKLGSSRVRNFNKAFKVAISERIKDNQHRLPQRFSVVYPLTSVSDEIFASLLEDKTLTPNTTRDELAKKIRDLKKGSQEEKAESKHTVIDIPSGYLIIKSELEFNFVDESLMNELKTKLDQLGWSICESPVTLDSSKKEENAHDDANSEDLPQGDAG
jgi:hypothetical protein